MFFKLDQTVAITLNLLAPVISKTVRPSSFAASKAVDVAAISSASDKLKHVPAHATYPLSIQDHKDKSTIHSDWASFAEGSAFVFKADMDTDCDGLDYKCDGNADGQPLTNWGALSAYEVPFIVIPQRFMEVNPKTIPGNNIAAVICNNKMFYGILGDTNGNDPQVTGEASWLLARSCFPEANLTGNKGHDDIDVTYILFTGDEAVLPPSAINEHYITDFTKLRSMGNHLTASLMKNLGIKPLNNTDSPPPKDDGSHDGKYDDDFVLPDVPPDNIDNPTNNTNDDNQGGSSDRPGPDSGEDNDVDSSAANGTTPRGLALFIAVLTLLLLL
ncbi:fungal chitosanase of glycosyl hydrolase group 75-domain-containing protein [Aspergillus multicolor]|uniref:glycoside hydrolase family 75 protein n=1 Tax=Aspergillus multicolor TaxID=41759 RepID=UPI003CCE04F8